MTLLQSNAFDVRIISGGVPSYISGLNDYEVLELTNPVNGNVSLADALPSEWLSEPGTVGHPAIMAAWSGGAGDNTNNVLYVNGGGHEDSANNGLYKFDFNGTTQPVGWTVEPNSLSTIANTPLATIQHHQYPDGYAGSVHSYDGMWVRNGIFYRTGGSPWRIGFWSKYTWKYTGTDWERLDDWPVTGSGRANVVYDPNTDKTFACIDNAFGAAFYNHGTETWGSQIFMSGVFVGGDASIFINPETSEVYACDGGGMEKWNVDFVNETVSGASFSPSGDTEIFGTGLAAVWDPTRGHFWLLGGGTQAANENFITTPGYRNLYEMSTTGVCTRRALNFDNVPIGGFGMNYQNPLGAYSTYNRIVFMDDWRAIGIATSTDDPAYIIKLPS